MGFFQRRKLKSLQNKVQKTHHLYEQQNSAANLKNLVAAQYDLAKFYEQHFYDRTLPHAEKYALECYRAVAALGEAKAQYICGQRLLDQAKFWDNWSRSPIYGAEIHKKYSKACFEEAMAYLNAADHQDYPYARRLLGLIHINGWGVPLNTDQGFKLVLESIDLEKSWDRATKIFEELKLNSPEFFAALGTYKK